MKGDGPIARPPATQPPSREGPRVNDEITSLNVRVIDPEGNQLGVLSVKEAIDEAERFGLDLVEVSPNADPPVCKILDFGKFKYEAQKKKQEARKKQRTIDVKEIKIRPNIEEHDYSVKMRSMQRFLEEGDKVKVTLRFRGRELQHQDRALALLKRIQGDLEEMAKVEQFPKLEGRQMIMVMAPAKVT